jgi:uncharacterized protein YndB with AHSA1/START domain
LGISLEGNPIMPNTVRLHRVLATTPEKIYRAFLEADALAKWLPPNGFTCTVHHLEPNVGGKFKMSFRNFTTGKSHEFGGEYVELVPGERLRYTDKFDDPGLPGEIQVTVRLKKVSVGTELDVTQAGLRTSFHPRLVIWAGRNPCETWQGSSNPRSTNNASRFRSDRACCSPINAGLSLPNSGLATAWSGVLSARSGEG